MNTCVFSYTEAVRKKAEALYNQHRDFAEAVSLPPWSELNQFARIEWLRFAQGHQAKRENKLMP